MGDGARHQGWEEMLPHAGQWAPGGAAPPFGHSSLQPRGRWKGGKGAGRRETRVVFSKSSCSLDKARMWLPALQGGVRLGAT